MKSSGTAKPLESGTRIMCYWPDDDQWYEGAVADQVDDDRFWIKYDDGDEEGMNIKEDKWRRASHPDKYAGKQAREKKQAKIAKLKPGSRIVVYFAHEKEYYAGTLTKKRAGSFKKAPHRIEYDDGDKEWTDLMFRRFKRIPKKSDELKVGSRVAVYDRRERRTIRQQWWRSSQRERDHTKSNMTKQAEGKNG